MTTTDQQTISELAANNVKLTHELHVARQEAAEYRRHSAESVEEIAELKDQVVETQAALDHAIQLMHDQTDGSYHALAQVKQLNDEVTVLRAEVRHGRKLLSHDIAELQAIVDVAQSWRRAQVELTSHMNSCGSEDRMCDRCDELGGAECTAQAVLARVLDDEWAR